MEWLHVLVLPERPAKLRHIRPVKILRGVPPLSKELQLTLERVQKQIFLTCASCIRFHLSVKLSRDASEGRDHHLKKRGHRMIVNKIF